MPKPRDGGSAPLRPARYRDGFAWTRNDALVAIGAAAVDLVAYSLGAADGLPMTVPALGLLVLADLCLVTRRSHPVGTLGAVLAAVLALNLTTPLPVHFAVGPVIALYTVARLRGPAVTAAAAAVVVPVSLAGQTGTGELLRGAVGNTLTALLVAGAGAAMRRWQREAEANRTLLADRAVAAERRRIARELHDIVAHHITTMQLMAGGARANLDHRPDAAREALMTLEGSGRMALHEMRRLLDVLRAGDEAESDAPLSPQPGADDLGRIIAESRLGGLDTELTVDGPAHRLPPTVGLTVFRIVQEALTNTRKHAGPARARVRLTYGPEEVRVEVHDDGAGAEAAAVRSAGPGGYGLIGMRERVALQGGTLEAGALADGGFRVAARLPLAGAAEGREEEDHR